MVNYYTNRELSSVFNINLAKWKRWSREFIPPDPLGGRQSGYARQYNVDQAFTVFLGGHLVSNLKYSIPEAKQILKDLKPWLVKKGFYLYGAKDEKNKDLLISSIREYKIRIRQIGSSKNPKKGLKYTIFGRISIQRERHQDYEIYEERYVKKTISNKEKYESSQDLENDRLLNITGILIFFIQKLGLDNKDYLALSGYI